MVDKIIVTHISVNRDRWEYGNTRVSRVQLFLDTKAESPLEQQEQMQLL